MKPALALDLDDLIYPFMETLVPFHNERHGTALAIEDYYTFEFSLIWNNELPDALKRIDDFFLELDELDAHPGPLQGSTEAVHALAQRYRLYIVTSRPDELANRTTRWLEKHFPDVFSGVYLCNSYVEEDRKSKRSKASVVEELDAVGLVDDSADHIREVANHGRTAILFGDYAWNRSAAIPANARRAQSWDEVMELLLRKES